VPYLVTRDDFIARLYHQRTGYWQPDGQGLDPRSAEETAAALDLLAGEKADAFVTAAATLAGQGDLALALEILTPGLLRHPDSSELAELRQAVLVRLMEQPPPVVRFRSASWFTPNWLAPSSPRSDSGDLLYRAPGCLPPGQPAQAAARSPAPPAT
jgi:hypothetical protein